MRSQAPMHPTFRGARHWEQIPLEKLKWGSMRNGCLVLEHAVSEHFGLNGSLMQTYSTICVLTAAGCLMVQRGLRRAADGRGQMYS